MTPYASKGAVWFNLHVSESARPDHGWRLETPFNAGRIRQNIKVQNLRQEQALLAYEQAALIALEEVENAFVAYRQAQLRLHQLAEAEKAQQRAVGLAHDRYRSGLVDLTANPTDLFPPPRDHQITGRPVRPDNTCC